MSEVYRIRTTPIRIARIYPGGDKSVNMAPFMRVWPGRPDPIQHEIVSKASKFNYLDINRDFKSSRELFKDEYYEAILNEKWGFDLVGLNLMTSTWIDEDHAGIYASGSNISAIQLICKGNTLAASPAHPIELGRQSKERLIWQGYQEENNFWGLFSNYIDDSAEKVEAFYISPYGTPIIKFRDLEKIDNRILEDFAMFFAIMKNIKHLEYNIHISEFG